MNIFEFENERFGNLWTEKDIEKVRDAEPQERQNTDIVYWDGDEKYIEFQEANWFEYFDFAKTYKYCLFK